MIGLNFRHDDFSTLLPISHAFLIYKYLLEWNDCF